jgi:hypothetical protein
MWPIFIFGSVRLNVCLPGRKEEEERLTSSIKLVSSLKSNTFLWRWRFGIRSFCCVERVDVCLVMFLVVESHDLF